MPAKKTERINRRYEVQSDERNFILVEKSETKEGKTYESNVGYFSTLESLRRYAVRHLLRVEGVDALQDAQGVLDDLFNDHQKGKPRAKEVEPHKLPEDYDEALLGQCYHTDLYIYDLQKCIELDAVEMGYITALEHVTTNVAGARGEGFPLFVYSQE